MTDKEIRRSVVAGSFYPGDPQTLQTSITGYLEEAEYHNLKNIKGLVSPHAGYIYSGQVAAFSYRQVMDSKYESIFLIAPSHSEYFDFNSVFAGNAYETPMGNVLIDTDRCMRLGNSSGYSDYIKISGLGHRGEHSLEVQLPFLQTIFEEFKIVPVVMGSQNRTNIESLGKAIGELFAGENILIIASTDLSHYHPYDVATELDRQVEKTIKDFDTQGFTDAVTSESLEMCGGGPVASAMIASELLGANSTEILCYKNSGDVRGDRSAVVGYLSCAFYNK
jgi:AmmeMemoRadiSam system protein B